MDPFHRASVAAAAAHWPVAEIYPTIEGALLPRADARRHHHDWRARGGVRVTEDDGLLLPRCRGSDVLLAQPPLRLRLNRGHAEAFASAEANRIFAATILGPVPAEKQRNEDFALAATLTDRTGAKHAFIAVADGVTSKTFWAERASRLSCFIAFQIASEHLAADGDYTSADVAALRQTLSSRLMQELASDRELLMQEDATPADWCPDAFRRFKGRSEYWYNTTLLICLLGPAGGLALWSGDGAVKITKRRGGALEHQWPLRSTADMAVSNVVSLDGPICFGGGRFATGAELDGASVALLTDGVDRTLQQNGDPLQSFAAPSSASVRQVLESLGKLPRHDSDNYSLAVASWPIASRAARH